MSRIMLPLSIAYYDTRRTIYKLKFGNSRLAANYVSSSDNAEPRCMAAAVNASRSAKLVLDEANEFGIAKVRGVTVRRCPNRASTAEGAADVLPDCTRPVVFCPEHSEGGVSYTRNLSIRMRALVFGIPPLLSTARVARFRIRRVTNGDWDTSRLRTHDMPLIPKRRAPTLLGARVRPTVAPAPSLAVSDGEEAEPSSHQTLRLTLATWRLFLENDALRKENARVTEQIRNFEPIVFVNGAILINDEVEGGAKPVQMCGCCEAVPANAVAVECGHLYACIPCSRHLEGRCPLCRSATTFVELRCATR